MGRVANTNTCSCVDPEYSTISWDGFTSTNLCEDKLICLQYFQTCYVFLEDHAYCPECCLYLYCYLGYLGQLVYLGCQIIIDQYKRMVKYKYVSISARLTVQSPLLSSCLNAQLLNAHNSCFQGSGSDFLSIATRPDIREIPVQSNQKGNRGGCGHNIYQPRHSHIISKWREGRLSSEHVQRTLLSLYHNKYRVSFLIFPLL